MLAYLFPAFPVFHQTFVLWEVMGLRRNGVPVKVFALRRPSTHQQQPEARELAAEVSYLPAVFSRAVLRANWRFLRTGPGRYARIFVEVFRAWRTGRMPPAREALGQDIRPVTLYDRIRGWFNTQPVLYLLKSFWLVPGAVYLADEIKVQSIRHLHAHWATYPATVAYIVHLISGLPFSFTAHAYDIYMVQRMLPAKLRAARFVVTCAKSNAAFLRGLASVDMNEKLVVSYHGVDINRFTPPGEGRSNGCFTIMSCGQLEQYKGMHLLIDACGQLFQKGVKLKCWIIGEGPQRRHLQQQIERLELGSSVQLLGSRAHAEVAQMMGQVDVFALASEFNGRFGRRDVIANVIVEAMAAGLPVVASHLPGVEELVEHGTTGLLVRPNGVAELAEALAALERSPEDRARYGQAARRRVVRDFDNKQNVRHLARLFADVAAGDADRSIAMASA